MCNSRQLCRNDSATWKQIRSLSITHGPAIKVSRTGCRSEFQMAASVSTASVPFLPLIKVSAVMPEDHCGEGAEGWQPPIGGPIAVGRISLSWVIAPNPNPNLNLNLLRAAGTGIKIRTKSRKPLPKKL